MKCRLCGCEISSDKDYCPMCGTKVVEVPKANVSSNTEIAWNTKDFPKPKQLEDIDMKWDNGFNSFMTKDASEGFVSVEKNAHAEEKPFEKPIDPFELPSQMKTQKVDDFVKTAQAQQQSQPSSEPKFDAWKIPPQQEAQMPLWYTQNFTATGVMKTGPAFPIAQPPVPPQPVMPQAPATPMPAVSAQQAAAAFSAAMPDATIQYMRVDPPQPVYKTDYEAYKPDYDAVPAQQQKAPEKFNTFMAKNAEFQALLDKEYDRIHAARKEDARPAGLNIANKFVPESRVQVQSISDFEKNIFGEEEPKKEEAPVKAFSFDDLYDEPVVFPKPVVKPEPIAQVEPIVEKEPEPVYQPEAVSTPSRAFAYDSDITDIDLDELIADPLDPKFNIHTIELTIKQLELEEQREEAERKNRQSRLEAMKAAREAYFKFLDEEKEEVKEEVKEEPVKLSEVEDFTRNTIEMDEESSAAFQKEIEDATRLPSELVDLYGDDEDEEAEEPKKSHGIFKFLFVLVIVVALVEGCVLGLQHFFPDANITAQAVEMQEAVVDAVSALFRD